MNDVPHDDDSSDDIDDLYRQAAAQDPGRPSPHVRKAVLQRAAQLAAQRTHERPSPPHQAKQYFPPRRWALLGTLAAAVLAGLVVAPQFLLTPQPTTPKAPVEIARIQEPSPSPQAGRPSPPRAESLQSSVAAPSPQAPAIAPPSLEEIAPPPPPKVAMKSAAPLERSKAVAKNRVERESAARADDLESVIVTAAKAAPAPPGQQAHGATTMVNAQSAEVAVGGQMTPDAMFILNEAPNSPLVGAATRRAAEQGDVATLQFLLDRGADINARDADNRSPLMLAVTHSRAKVVELLLAHGADANAADRSGTTPLRAAESSHQSVIAATLRAAGAH